VNFNLFLSNRKQKHLSKNDELQFIAPARQIRIRLGVFQKFQILPHTSSVSFADSPLKERAKGTSPQEHKLAVKWTLQNRFLFDMISERKADFL
jgi:hypothetical protein